MGRMIIGGRLVYEGSDSDLKKIFDFMKNAPTVPLEKLQEDSRKFEAEVIADYKRRGIIKNEYFAH